MLDRIDDLEADLFLHRFHAADIAEGDLRTFDLARRTDLAAKALTFTAIDDFLIMVVVR